MDKGFRAIRDNRMKDRKELQAFRTETRDSLNISNPKCRHRMRPESGPYAPTARPTAKNCGPRKLHPWECPPLAPPLQDQITEERSDPPVVEGTIRRLDGNPVRGPSASRQTAIPRVMAAIEPVAGDR